MQADIQQLMRSIDEANRVSARWRILQVYTQPSMALGLFLLAIGVPMLVGGLRDPRVLVQATQFISSALIIGIGFVALTAPIQIQEYFVRKPDRMMVFFDLNSQSDGQRFEKILFDWAQQEGEGAGGLRQAARLIRIAVAVGNMTLVILALIYLGLYFTTVWVIAHTDSAVIAILWGAAPPVLLLITIVLLWLSKHNKERPAMADEAEE